MKIRQKLISGFLVVSLLIVAVTYVSIIIQKGLTTSYRKIAGEVLPGTVALINMDLTLFHSLVHATEYALTGDIKDKEEVEALIADLRKHMTIHKLYHARHDASEQSKIIADEIDTFINVITEYVLLKDKDGGQEELRIVRTKLNKVAHNFTSSVGPFIEKDLQGAREITKITKQHIVKARQLILGSSGVILIIALALGFFISHLISKPILKLTEATAQIGKGKLDTKIEIKSKDEIGQLARSVNTMTTDLQRVTVSRDSFALEVDERKKAVGELQQSEEYLKALLDSIHAGIMVVDPETHTIVDANSSALKMMAINKEQVIGRICHEFICPAEKKKCPITDLEQTLDLSECVLINRSGEQVPILKSVVPLTRKGRRYLIESFVDITDLKRVEKEKEKIQSQLFHAQKMKAVGTLAGGIAHDFNNTLTVIQGNAQLMSMDLDTTNPHYELVKEIEGRVKAASNLTQQLLGFARGGKYEVKSFNLNDMVRESSTAFGRTQKDITINLRLRDDLPPIEADTGQIEQVLMNLYVNAAHAMPDGGDLYLETRCVDQADIQGKPYSIEPGRYVLLSVRDTGVGMDKETQKRIFEPFFSTKEKGRGTGLGLASVYGIIKNHKGYVNLYSEKDHGTVFNIYLPVSEREVERPVKVADHIIRGTETILLVDDEEPVLKAEIRILNELGYTVLKAGNGREAVDIYTTGRDKIDLVILDMIMPDMSGGKTYELLKSINPDVKVLLASGYSTDSRVASILERGCDGFIQKPFSMVVLSHKIRDIIDG